MKELYWIILTSWSPPPRTLHLQQAGLHCSALPLYIYIYVCVCVVYERENGVPIPPTRRLSLSHMNVNHLFNWLPWLDDLYLKTVHHRALPPVIIPYFACSLSLYVCVLLSIHSPNSSKHSWPGGTVTCNSDHPLVLPFYPFPSSPHRTPSTHLSSLLVPVCPANTCETGILETHRNLCNQWSRKEQTLKLCDV